MFFDSGKRLVLQVRTAEHASVPRNQRAPRRRQLRQPVRLIVQLTVGADCRIVRKKFRNELRLADEAHFDGGSFVLAPLGRDDHGEEGKGCRGNAERREKDLRAEAEAHVTSFSASLYPNCFTVTSASTSVGNFSLRRRTWTSTVRVPPV